MIRFTCWRCGKSVKADDDQAGKQCKCTCGQTVTIPAAAPPATFEAAVSASALPPAMPRMPAMPPMPAMPAMPLMPNVRPAGSAPQGAPRRYWLITGGGAAVLLLVLTLIFALRPREAKDRGWQHNADAIAVRKPEEQKGGHNKGQQILRTTKTTEEPPRKGEERKAGHNDGQQILRTTKTTEEPPRKGEERKADNNPPRKEVTKRIAVAVDFLRSRAKGQRFAIVADRSGSMSAPVVGGTTSRRSIDLLHEELIKTLNKLPVGTQFYVSFYSNGPMTMPYGDSWLDGGKDVKKITPWIMATRPSGGTQPLGSFRKVFALNPRPDVIFFMTDGLIPSNVADDVARLNANGQKVVINTILFQNNRAGGIDRNKPQLVQIAHESGGTFTQFPEPANRAVHVVDLMKEKRVMVKLLAVSMNRVTVRIDFPDKASAGAGKLPNEIIVPAGTYLRSSNPKYQNLIVVEESSARVTRGAPVDLTLSTCCTNILKAAPGPSSQSNYRLERLPENNAIVRFVRAHAGRNTPIRDMQRAVWNFTTLHKLND